MPERLPGSGPYIKDVTVVTARVGEKHQRSERECIRERVGRRNMIRGSEAWCLRACVVNRDCVIAILYLVLLCCGIVLKILGPFIVVIARYCTAVNNIQESLRTTGLH